MKVRELVGDGRKYALRCQKTVRMLSDDQLWMLGAIIRNGGFEANREWHEDAEVLRSAGLVRVSGARGPGQEWKRVELLKEEETA